MLTPAAKHMILSSIHNFDIALPVQITLHANTARYVHEIYLYILQLEWLCFATASSRNHMNSFTKKLKKSYDKRLPSQPYSTCSLHQFRVDAMDTAYPKANNAHYYYYTAEHDTYQ